jgi:hypothetical protein
MKPHPRIRKTIKWGGAAVTLLLVVVWIGSGWVSAGRYGFQYHILIAGGCVIPQWPTGGNGDYPAPGWVCTCHHWHVTRWWPFLNDSGAWVRLYIPIWLLAVMAALLAGTARYFDTLARRRARLNLCPKCGYDRAGLAASAVCPECGMAEQR